MTKTKGRLAPTEKHGGAGAVRKRAKADAQTPAPGAAARVGTEHGGRRRRAPASAAEPQAAAAADSMRLGALPAEGHGSPGRTARSNVREYLRGAAREDAPDRTARTTAGEYLLGAAREDGPGRFGTPPSPVDDHARRVWRHAFGLAVRRRFEPDSPLAEISRVVAAAIHAGESAGLPVLAAEMLVRAELGETVPVDEIAPAVRAGVHLLLFVSLVDELALGDGELETLMTRAELAAAECDARAERGDLRPRSRPGAP